MRVIHQVLAASGPINDSALVKLGSESGIDRSLLFAVVSVSRPKWRVKAPKEWLGWRFKQGRAGRKARRPCSGFLGVGESVDQPGVGGGE